MPDQTFIVKLSHPAPPHDGLAVITDVSTGAILGQLHFTQVAQLLGRRDYAYYKAQRRGHEGLSLYDEVPREEVEQ